MKNNKKIFIILFSVLLTFPAVSYGYWIWTPETGKWINPQYAAKDTPKDQFDYAMSYYEAQDYKRAVKEFEKLIKVFPKSKYAPESQYYAAESYQNLDEYYKAFQAYQKVIDIYPYTERLDEIIKKQYDIGVMFFEGKKGKFLGLPVIASADRAIEVLNKVVENSPYGQNADQAYFKLGIAYKQTGNYKQAQESFKKIEENFPKSKLFEKAKYEAAYCAYHFSLAPSYDQHATEEAVKEFQEFVEMHPDSDIAKEAESRLQELQEKRAKKLYDIALFYESQKRAESALMYYKDVKNKYPSTSWANKASEKIQILGNK